jgi:hypothetical protein
MGLRTKEATMHAAHDETALNHATPESPGLRETAPIQRGNQHGHGARGPLILAEADPANIAIVRRLGGRCSPRELSRAVWHLRRLVLAQAVLQGMVDRGLGRWIIIVPGKRGGRPSTKFELTYRDHDETGESPAEQAK